MLALSNFVPDSTFTPHTPLTIGACSAVEMIVNIRSLKELSYRLVQDSRKRVMESAKDVTEEAGLSPIGVSLASIFGAVIFDMLVIPPLPQLFEGDED